MANPRTLPNNVDAEKFILGAIQLDGNLYADASAVLGEDDFTLERHRIIFRRMGELDNIGIEINRSTVADRLMNKGDLEEAGGLGYLVSLDDGMPRAATIDSHIALVKEKSRLRKIIYAAQSMEQKAFAAQDQSGEIINAANNALLDIGTHLSAHSHTAAEILHQYPGGYNEFMDPSLRPTGVTTGFLRLDNMTGGLRPGEIFVLGARPSQGKTAMALNIACHVALNRGERVVVFSLETSKEAMLQRAMCSIARVDSHSWRQGYLNPTERNRANEAMHQLVSSKLMIDDTASLSVGDMRSRVAKIAKREGPVSLVAIDYLQLMISKLKTDNRVQQVTEITRSIKIAAKELNVPILLLSQLSRAVEQRKGDHRPMMSDLRESGSIEQDADLIGFIFREEVYRPDREDLRGCAELILAKQKSGATGTIDLVWLGNITRFENRAEDTGETE